MLWGPMAAYVIAQSPENSYTVIPMQSTANIKFDFAMAMGVRKSDKERKDLLDKLISENSAEIKTIMESYHVPLVPITK